MMNLFNSNAILLAATVLFTNPGNQVKTKTAYDTKIIFQANDAATLNELNALCSKQLRAASLAAKQGNSTKEWGNRISVTLSGFSDELKVLAKKKSIQLAGTLPEGGQRPDGRVDSSPENMRDTSRLSNAGGEAGNSGMVKTTPKGINDGASNALVESLAKLKGNTFDITYRNLLISDRPIAEKLLSRASASKDSEISAFAKKYLGKLRSTKI
ncbi:hypothetical protein [Pedobacter miscanthi]|uniref:DUF4142 domain-containing protein n=1 Tax=Pedobacter miscanthi TaxID=2259170 RepID=A0A366L7X6_9SPHI|nr:hypothetical protein [Pedobacter miscanthi]RBQ09981.1 hypothetical protein DRW42_05965 [Pedobacter miscanthi]